MVKELKKDIRAHIFASLKEIYNDRKEDEGLVSAQNCLIRDLKKKIDEWVEDGSCECCGGTTHQKYKGHFCCNADVCKKTIDLIQKGIATIGRKK